jgi:hypothetical protein
MVDSRRPFIDYFVVAPLQVEPNTYVLGEAWSDDIHYEDENECDILQDGPHINEVVGQDVYRLEKKVHDVFFKGTILTSDPMGLILYYGNPIPILSIFNEERKEILYEFI